MLIEIISDISVPLTLEHCIEDTLFFFSEFKRKVINLKEIKERYFNIKLASAESLK